MSNENDNQEKSGMAHEPVLGDSALPLTVWMYYKESRRIEEYTEVTRVTPNRIYYKYPHMEKEAFRNRETSYEIFFDTEKAAVKHAMIELAEQIKITEAKLVKYNQLMKEYAAKHFT